MFRPPLYSHPVINSPAPGWDRNKCCIKINFYARLGGGHQFIVTGITSTEPELGQAWIFIFIFINSLLLNWLWPIGWVVPFWRNVSSYHVFAYILNFDLIDFVRAECVSGDEDERCVIVCEWRKNFVSSCRRLSSNAFAMQTRLNLPPHHSRAAIIMKNVCKNMLFGTRNATTRECVIQLVTKKKHHVNTFSKL